MRSPCRFLLMKDNNLNETCRQYIKIMLRICRHLDVCSTFSLPFNFCMAECRFLCLDHSKRATLSERHKQQLSAPGSVFVSISVKIRMAYTREPNSLIYQWPNSMHPCLLLYLLPSRKKMEHVAILFWNELIYEM